MLYFKHFKPQTQARRRRARRWKRARQRYYQSSDSSFDAKELKQTSRDDLKVPTSAVSNAESDSLVAALDDDDGGDLSIDEISNFVERGAATFKIDDLTINEGNERSAKCPPCAAWRV